MELLDLIAVLISITALLALANFKWLKLPMTIGVMLLALVLSLILIGLGKTGLFPADVYAEKVLANLDFDKTLLHGMLSFLLFAGALHIDLDKLAEQKWVVLTLATGGVVLSTFIIGSAMWWAFGFFGLAVPWVYCLLFGALITPTDPIAVLSTLKTVGIKKSLEIKIAGESLFNDGVGVVVFLVVLDLATGTETPTVLDAATVFAEEAIGGAIFGIVLGYLGYFLLKTVDNYQVEVLITLALVTGGYAAALHLHTSGPIAIVIAGLFIGNQGRYFAMSAKTRQRLDDFWELIDESLNAVLFVLIGLELLLINVTLPIVMIGLLAIPIVLLARFISVGLPVSLLRLFRSFSPYAVRMLVWGGIRGGISVALALSLPQGEFRDLLVGITYIIVVFSILVQGLTIGRLARSAGAGDKQMAT